MPEPVQIPALLFAKRLRGRSFWENCWSATCQWSPFSYSGHLSPSSLPVLQQKAVRPSCLGQPRLSNPRGIQAHHHGMSPTCGGSPLSWPAPPCVLSQQWDTGGETCKGSLSAPHTQSSVVNWLKVISQTHILAQNERSVILISPQHCLFIMVEKDNLYHVAHCGHHCSNYVTERSDCLVDCLQRLSSAPESLLSLKWAQKKLLF